jgi:hypothetical protein
MTAVGSVLHSVSIQQDGGDNFDDHYVTVANNIRPCPARGREPVIRSFQYCPSKVALSQHCPGCVSTHL